jgi:hypothetical protein
MSASRFTDEVADESFDFDVAVLGGALPPAAEALIAQAGLIRQQVPEALALLEQAHVIAPRHPATLIALYRFHFYGHRLKEAREISKQSMDIGRAALGDELCITDEQARFDPAARFYLFALKGHAYLSLRLGDIEAGRLALADLRQLDPQDRVGGGVLTHVLMRAESGQAHDEAFSTPIAHRGWSKP